MDANRLTPHSDICIIGGGIAALTLARLLQQTAPSQTLTVISSDSIPNSAADGKTIVIDRPTATCLQQLNALPQGSQPITRVQISIGNLIRKTIGNRSANADNDTTDTTNTLGYSVNPAPILQTLAQNTPLHQARVETITKNPDNTHTITTASGSTHHTTLLIIACPLPHLPAPFTTRHLHYAQTILTLNASTTLPAGEARQRYARRRVLVLVPRPNSATPNNNANTGVIICAPAATAHTLTTQTNSTLSTHLSKEFNHPITIQGTRHTYTPQLTRTTPHTHSNIILLGSGATTLHPIGAQAISLAVQDAQKLSTLFKTHNGTPPKNAIATHARQRQQTHTKKALQTSTLALGAFGAIGLF